MSLILDALNKADQERRKHDDPPGLGSHHDDDFPTPKHNRFTFGIAVACIGIAIAFAAAYWLWPTKSTSNIAPLNNGESDNTVQQSAATPTLEAASIPVTHTAAIPVPAGSHLPQAPDSNTNDVEALYQRSETPLPTDASLASTVPDNSSPPPVVALSTKPAEVPVNPIPTPSPTVEPEPRHPTLADFASVGNIRSLSWTIQEKIPSLNYSDHRYMPNEKGFIVINGQKVRKGGLIEKGLLLESVLQDGALMKFEGKIFKIPALNSWVNM
ncbi:general secretion pathway protein GspB [Teredinibacter purpureus]|uniref:general secretion pathway protein GspB n=1 Tax=Teredinibacter purpureus TaxID=2731756 RepID=UPI0005F8043B|nr:general secretion pathway protein GspB [Teredinibacter purpureus]